MFGCSNLTEQHEMYAAAYCTDRKLLLIKHLIMLEKKDIGSDNKEKGNSYISFLCAAYKIHILRIFYRFFFMLKNVYTYIPDMHNLYVNRQNYIQK